VNPTSVGSKANEVSMPPIRLAFQIESLSIVVLVEHLISIIRPQRAQQTTERLIYRTLADLVRCSLHRFWKRLKQFAMGALCVAASNLLT